MFIDLYGYKFSKEDHVLLVKFTWSVLVTPDMDTKVMEVCIKVLSLLLAKKKLLTREDIGNFLVQILMNIIS